MIIIQISYTYIYINKNKMQFGKLTSYEEMEKYYNQMRAVSRTELLNKIYKSSGIKKQQNLQDSITQAFMIIIENKNFNYDDPIIKQILNIFGISKGQLDYKTPQQKSKYIQKKILLQIEQQLPKEIDKQQHIEYELQVNPEKDQHQFQWVGVKSNFPNLRSVFEEILLEKVRLFDQDLTRLSDLYQDQSKKMETLSTQRTLRNLNQRCKTQQTQKTARERSLKQIKRMKFNLQKKGFTNVLIRDHSQFTLSKWTKKQQKQFQKKSSDFKANFNRHSQKSQIIFQFVKKYTQTVKARDNIYSKWENRQKSGITPEQLRYLCSTSLFLNKTLNKSEKQRIRKNIHSLGKDIISRLQYNIAEKIIETYRQFLKKVSDLRGKYYEELTEKKKKQFVNYKKKQQKQCNKYQKKKEFQKYRDIFQNICNSEKMKVILKPKVYRWVKLFLKNIKESAQQKKGKKFHAFQNRPIFNRLFNSEKVSALLIKNKMKCPSSRIIQRQQHKGFRINTKNYVPTTRFEYDKSFQRHISQYNSVKVKNNKSYVNQLTGGPNLQVRDSIVVDIVTKQIILSSSKCLKSVIMIQAKWKMIFTRRKYLKMIENYREQMDKDFIDRKASLKSIYPEGKKIDLKALQNRLKRVSMRTLNVLKPYTRVTRKPINLYTSFCQIKLTLNQLKLKNSKNSQRRMGQLQKMVEENQFKKLKKSGFVLTAKEINAPIFKRGASPMWWAVKNSNSELTKIFLEGGGNPNSIDNQGNTCLHEAMQNGDLQIIFLLLDFGADLNIKNNKKMTALYYATPKMLKWLGLEEGSVSGDTNSLKDNNSLYFNPETMTNFYSDHYY